MSAHHGTELAALVARVGDAIDRHQSGEFAAFEVDDVIHRYTRSAKKLR